MDCFSYIGQDVDPIYLLLSKVTQDQPIQIERFEISLNNHGLYEIKSDEIHEAKPDLDSCYKFVKATIYHILS